MNERTGIFQVLMECGNKENCVLGTAFAIKTYEVRNKYYLLTAYHVISELEAKGCAIIVRDEDGKVYNATKVFPANLSCEYRTFGQDYALLEMYSDEKYQAYEIAVIDKRSECFVRGAVPHYSTVFTSFDGKILGKESIVNQSKVLQINLDTHLIFEHNNRFIPEQKVLRGLSGAPVLVDIEGKTVCVGVLGNLERDCRGSVKYAVPIETIIEDCLKGLHIAYELYYENEFDNSVFRRELMIQLTIGDEDEFLFSEEELELEAWNKLSNSFYKGIPVDYYLNELVTSDNFNHYPAEVRCAVLYYYARLLFKRGKTMQAFHQFNEISKLFNVVSSESKLKLVALIDSRSAIERKIELPKDTLNSIQYASEKIIHLPKSSDVYISNELASMYGRGLTNLFSINAEYTSQEKKQLYSIYKEHETLLEKNPKELCKQDVVNTSLKWYISLWCVNKEYDLQELSVAVRNGFRQSKVRKNNIFYIQSMISYGILCALNNETKRAVKILILSVRLILAEGVHLNHEGIRQLLLFLKDKFLSLYAIVELAYRTGMNQEFINKGSLYQIDLGIYTLQDVLYQVQELYALKYHNHKKIYNVPLEEIEVFL